MTVPDTLKLGGMTLHRTTGGDVDVRWGNQEGRLQRADLPDIIEFLTGKPSRRAGDRYRPPRALDRLVADCLDRRDRR